MITYANDILLDENYYGLGGFIYTESLVFILNALFPPFIWLVDPWSIKQDFLRNRYWIIFEFQAISEKGTKHADSEARKYNYGQSGL